MSKERIAIELSSEKIIILVGGQHNIVDAISLKMPSEAFVDEKIKNVGAIANVISEYLRSTRCKGKSLYFMIKGQDLITRHMTTPYLNDVATRDSVEWELNQYMGDRMEEFYFDYEIINMTADGKNKNAEILIVASEKEKIDKYMELAKLLKLEVKGIDTYATGAARVLRNMGLYGKGVKSIGLVNIDGKSSGMSIVEKGRLAIEKYQNIGIISSMEENLAGKEFDNYISNIDLYDEEDDEVFKMEKVFNTIGTYFNSIIQFYATGKVKKTLDKIYVVGAVTKIENVETKLSHIFNTNVEILPSFDWFKFTVKTRKNIHLKDYFYAYSLFLRKE